MTGVPGPKGKTVLVTGDVPGVTVTLAREPEPEATGAVGM